jgi:hypothetical protein
LLTSDFFAFWSSLIRSRPHLRLRGFNIRRHTVCGQVASATYAVRSRGRPTFLNLDRPYPRKIFTALIWGENRNKFSVPPEKLYNGKEVCRHWTDHKLPRNAADRSERAGSDTNRTIATLIFHWVPVSGLSAQRIDPNNRSSKSGEAG